MPPPPPAPPVTAVGVIGSSGGRVAAGAAVTTDSDRAAAAASAAVAGVRGVRAQRSDASDVVVAAGATGAAVAEEAGITAGAAILGIVDHEARDRVVGRVGSVAAAPAVTPEEAGIAALAWLNPQSGLGRGRAVAVTAAAEEPAAVLAVGDAAMPSAPLPIAPKVNSLTSGLSRNGSAALMKGPGSNMPLLAELASAPPPINPKVGRQMPSGHGSCAGSACAVPIEPKPMKAAVMAPPTIAPPTARRATVPRAEDARCLPANVVLDIFYPSIDLNRAIQLPRISDIRSRSLWPSGWTEGSLW